MKATTKFIAWLWIVAACYSLVKPMLLASTWERPAFFVFTAAGIAFTEVVPSLALIKGRVIGWWAILLLSILNLTVSLFAAFAVKGSSIELNTSELVAWVTFYAVSVTLLALDRPMKWRFAERDRKVKLLDVLAAAPLVYAVFVVMPIVWGALDWMWTSVADRILW